MKTLREVNPSEITFTERAAMRTQCRKLAKFMKVRYPIGALSLTLLAYELSLLPCKRIRSVCRGTFTLLQTYLLLLRHRGSKRYDVSILSICTTICDSSGLETKAHRVADSLDIPGGGFTGRRYMSKCGPRLDTRPSTSDGGNRRTVLDTVTLQSIGHFKVGFTNSFWCCTAPSLTACR